MAGLKLFTALLLVISLLAIGGKWVEAQVHHVVGGESGWHPSSDLGSWAAGRNFRVGDHLWFGYVPAQDSVVELETMEEYLSCDLANPIRRMLTDGINKISLEEEGLRYFASGNPESCKNGLKLQLNVMNESMAATGPTPSSSAHPNGFPPYMLFIGLLLFLHGHGV